ncbi:large ribosomal RNA subunit accumulation protein YCED homolog 2, chloroplastic [Dendrobium catenatum]|uniref:large ribosomal RNA subunit accumulation protein YCED homolog 2, chloroplastic n=1 Tax=Dendrobium catenatum TaxID=906689 RepID=UPI0009F1670F|nr:large ribosomal RNA subunit accumulation protein YCED homolog 2, chloroplastic [Dendrobium catenatum]
MAALRHFISEHFNHSLYLLQNPKKIAQKSQKLSVSVSFPSHFRTEASSSNKHSVSQHTKRKSMKSGRTSRRLITISTSCGKWQGQWNCDYLLSLRELQLADLAEEGDDNAEVLVSLSIQKHTGFGFSVDGRIVTSMKGKCSCCFSSYYREIDTTFDVWILPSSKDSEHELPQIGGSDQVIYVKPGSEADLDSVVQDTIRLIASTKDTCSESCEKSAITWQCTAKKRTYDQRWSQLLELKNAM